MLIFFRALKPPARWFWREGVSQRIACLVAEPARCSYMFIPKVRQTFADGCRQIYVFSLCWLLLVTVGSVAARFFRTVRRVSRRWGDWRFSSAQVSEEWVFVPAVGDRQHRQCRVKMGEPQDGQHTAWRYVRVAWCLATSDICMFLPWSDESQ